MAKSLAYKLGGGPDYEQYVLSLGPVGYWPLSERSGSSAGNLVASGNAGSVSGSGFTWGSRRFATRLSAGSAQFADNTNLITVANYAALYQEQFTVSAWLKSDVSDYAAGGVVCGSAGTGGGTNWFLFVVATTDTWRVFVRDDSAGLSSSHDFSGPVAVDTNGHHWAVTCNNTTRAWELFLDGTSAGSVVVTYAFDNTNAHPFLMGNLVAQGTPWRGSLAQLAYFPRILTVDEIRAQYLLGKNGA